MKNVTVRSCGAKVLDKASAKVLDHILWAQNKLWNALVEIEHGARNAYNEALAMGDSNLAALVEEYAQEEAALNELMDARAKARAAARSKKTDVEKTLSESIKSASAKLKEMRVNIKQVKLDVKEKSKPYIEAAELARRQKVKDAVAESKLWWGHSELVLERFDAARVRAMKSGTMLKFHRFDGSGSTGVRFIESPGFGIDTILSRRSDLFDMSEPTQEDLGARKKAVTSNGNRRMVVTLRAGRKDEDGNIPKIRLLVTLQADRDLPKDVPLKRIVLRQDAHLNKFDTKVVFTFVQEVEALPEVDLQPKAVGIEFGFRQVKSQDGPSYDLRVCTAKWSDGSIERCVLDSHWISRMERADRLRSELDVSANDFQGWLKQSIKPEMLEAAGVGEEEWLRVLLGKISRSKGAYAQLLLTFCDAYKKSGIDLSVDIKDRIDAWSRYAYKLSLEAHHTRRKAVAHRKHLFLNFASSVVKRAGHVCVINTDFAKLAKLVDETGQDNELHERARKNRTWAAPSELRLALKQAAVRERLEYVDVPAAQMTQTCSACGHVHSAPFTDLMMVCQSCSKVMDQDENTASNVLNLGLSGSND